MAHSLLNRAAERRILLLEEAVSGLLGTGHDVLLGVPVDVPTKLFDPIENTIRATVERIVAQAVTEEETNTNTDNTSTDNTSTDSAPKGDPT